LRDQLQTLQEQQSEQVHQLQIERDAATDQLAGHRDENNRLNRDADELGKLRKDVARLRNAARSAQPPNAADAATSAAAQSWLARVDQLKQYVDQHPNEKIPEFQFLTPRCWLDASAPRGKERFEKEEDYQLALESLRFWAESTFLNLVQAALHKYVQDNNGQFPTDLSQLRSYCEPSVQELLLQMYEIKPANIMPEGTRKELGVKSDWVITRTKRVNPSNRSAVFPGGSASWLSPLGTGDP